MSYCRFSEGDVYLVKASQVHWECIACRLNEEGSRMFESINEVDAHLDAHVAAGHEVPTRARVRVLMESAEDIKKAQER